MMPESEDKKITEGTTNGAVIESSQSAEETQNAHEKVDVKSELRAPPAWLQKETNQGSSKVKLPPVTVAHVNKKRKRHSRNSRENSRVKLNSTIEPVPEELPNLNVNTWMFFPWLVIILEVIIDYGSAFVTYGRANESKWIQFSGRDAPDKISGGG